MKAGIVGYGVAGRYFHAPTLRSAGFEISAICTRSLERKAAAHQDFPNAILVNSVEELLDEELDLIVVASTNEVHVEHATAAINRGIATVVDKPVALNYFETLALFDLADARGVSLTAFFNRLWDSDSLTIKKALQEEVLGKPFRMESRYERFRPELNVNSWRETAAPELGGGLLLDLQTHLISTALDWFGPAELVFASLKEIRGGAEDDVTLVLHHQNNVDSYLSVSSVVGAPGPKLRVNGSKGSLVIKDLDQQEAHLRKGFLPRPGEWLNAAEVTSEARIHTGETSYNYPALAGDYPKFYQGVKANLKNGSELPVNREFALSVARIIDHAREINVGEK